MEAALPIGERVAPRPHTGAIEEPGDERDIENRNKKRRPSPELLHFFFANSAGLEPSAKSTDVPQTILKISIRELGCQGKKVHLKSDPF